MSVLPPQVYDLCKSGESVSAELAKDPTLEPGKVAKKLFGAHSPGEGKHGSHASEDQAVALKKAVECGRWGEASPSELFLQMYHDVLCSLDHGPLKGMTSPALMGSCGTVPVTIISPLVEICKHMANCIVRAETELFLATNFWIFSDASTIITNALRELSDRAGKRGKKIIVKMIYDRGNIKQLVNNHQAVPESDYTGPKVKLPSPSEVPHLDFQVVNYHKPALGTFHCKFMIVDRRLAILNSNNIQDNDNVEMAIQLEGPIVDSLYDMSLISWHNALTPPLPLHNSPAASANFSSFDDATFPRLFDESGKVSRPSDAASAEARATNIAEGGAQSSLEEHTSKSPRYDSNIAGEVLRTQATLNPRNGETRMQALTRYLNAKPGADAVGSLAECPVEDEMTPLIPLPPHSPFPIAMVCREPSGALTNSSSQVPQNAAWLSGIRNAKKSVFIQSPNVNAEPLVDALIAAARRGIDVTYYYCLGYNDAGELLPAQNGTNEMFANRLYSALEEKHHGNLNIFAYVAKDQVHPIHNKFKQRSCHIKLMIVDGHIGIQGNGNQDTQSWFHSQEINVMIDSELVCRFWRDAIDRNQNTKIYGAVQKEGKDAGCWIDPETGRQAEGAIGVDPGHFAWAKGVVGAVQRVRGAGGF